MQLLIGSGGTQRKIKEIFLAWKAWEQLCCPRIHGGLGFRTAKKSNEEFIEKLRGWLLQRGLVPAWLLLEASTRSRTIG